MVKTNRIHRKRGRTPQIAGGDWEAGRELYHGKATCGSCHTIRGEGFQVGPDLSNSKHSDFYSLVRNITRPSASINPDGVGYIVSLLDGDEVVGTRLKETVSELSIAQAGGVVATLKKARVREMKPMSVSLMPEGLFDALSDKERRDLLTYLLMDGASKRDSNP